jgi:hypothetical protein
MQHFDITESKIFRAPSPAGKEYLPAPLHSAPDRTSIDSHALIWRLDPRTLIRRSTPNLRLVHGPPSLLISLAYEEWKERGRNRRRERGCLTHFFWTLAGLQRQSLNLFQFSAA